MHSVECEFIILVEPKVLLIGLLLFSDSEFSCEVPANTTRVRKKVKPCFIEIRNFVDDFQNVKILIINAI